jgi:hypothetical protein
VLVDRVEIATGRRERVREIDAGDQAGMISIAEISLADDSRYYIYNRHASLSTLFLIAGAR